MIFELISSLIGRLSLFDFTSIIQGLNVDSGRQYTMYLAKNKPANQPRLICRFPRFNSSDNWIIVRSEHQLALVGLHHQGRG